MESEKLIKERKVAINLSTANAFAIILLFISGILAFIPFYLINGLPPVNDAFGVFCSVTFFALFFIGIIVHEGIHGLTWGLLNKGGFKSISFGIIWKMLTPYCHCSEPMSRTSYFLGAIMPCIVLGILPTIVSWFTGSWLTFVLGVIFIASAAGDIWMVWLLMKEPKEALFLNDDKEAAFWVIEKQ